MNEMEKNRDQEKYEVFQLKKGLNAIMMPELKNEVGTLGDLEPTFAPETLKRLQIFLDELENQGGEIVGIVPAQVRSDPEKGFRRNYIEDRHIFIIKK